MTPEKDATHHSMNPFTSFLFQLLSFFLWKNEHVDFLGFSPISPMFFLGSTSVKPQVLYLLRFQRGPRDVLLSSVQLGGDVDSVAALALATVAAREGCQWGTPRGLPWKLLEERSGVRGTRVEDHSTE